MYYSGGITVALYAGMLMVQTHEDPRRTCQGFQPEESDRLREAFETAYWMVRDKA